jgi:predicted 3-demethylubiquinone-9 3-methyltransferase (glyoxalase superfamily)
MQKIVPHLWFDKEAREAALFYTSLFDHSKLINVHVIENTPAGDSEFQF